MPITLEFDTTRCILRARVTIADRPDLDIYRQALERITSGVHYPPTVPIIWDLRDLAFAFFDTRVVKKMCAIHAEFPARKICRTAYVVANELGFGMMRMLQTLTETTESSQIFYDYDKAAQWISSAPAQRLEPVDKDTGVSGVSPAWQTPPSEQIG